MSAGELTLRPIGVVRSPFKELAEAPRQPRAAEGVRGRIELVSGLGLEDAIEDLVGWDYVWIVFWLDRAIGWKPKVLPPRSERKRGVLATRAPHRPNPIGLSAVKLRSVSGLVLEIEDLDLIDGTPVLDIKPYVPWTDAIPNARTGWLEPPEGAMPGGERPADPRPTWSVVMEPRAEEQLAWLKDHDVDLRERIVSALALGPQPHAYRRIKTDREGVRMSVKEWNVRFEARGSTIAVTAIETGRRASELRKPGSELHLALRHEVPMKKLAEGLVRGDDGIVRCFWSGSDPIYLRYHDDEWGKPTHDDHRLFEKLVLEGFQSGLSWLTILKKRERFREVFHRFDPVKVARFGERDVARLLKDAGIVRHRGKIEAAIHNASAANELIAKEGSLDAYLWSFVPPPSERPKRMRLAELRAMSTAPASIRLAKDLKKRGFRFVGPTTCYALMQAMGLVDDHLEGCARRSAYR